MKRDFLRYGMVLTLAALLAACASSRPLVTGQTRPAVAPEQVQVYYSAPTQPYEEIARLDVSSGAFTYGDQNKTNQIIQKLREQAASLGANGVVLLETQDGYGGPNISVGGGGGRIGGRGFSSAGIGVNVSPRQRHAMGIAIFVPQQAQPASQPQSEPAAAQGN